MPRKMGWSERLDRAQDRRDKRAKELARRWQTKTCACGEQEHGPLGWRREGNATICNRCGKKPL